MKNHLLALFACAVCTSALPERLFAREVTSGNLPCPLRAASAADGAPSASLRSDNPDGALRAEVSEAFEAPEASEASGLFSASLPADGGVPPETAPAVDDGVVSLPSDPSDPSDLSDLSAPSDLSDPTTGLAERLSAWERIRARLPRISGYLQLGYEWLEHTSSEFFIRRVRLDFHGDLAPKLDYRFHVELVSPRLLDAYLRYRPFDQLNLQVGEFKIPFSIENTEYPPTRFEFIDYPMALVRLMGFNDICGLTATGRDLGAQLYGGFWRREGRHLLCYNLALFNGEGVNAADRNRSKDFVARLTLRPMDGLQVSGSWYWGEYGEHSRKRVRYAAGACYDRGRFMLRGEYLLGVTGLPAAEPGGRPVEQESQGWYVAAGWRATRSLQPVVRCDTFEEDLRWNLRQTNYTAGLLWTPLKYLRCQLNYTFEDHYADAKARAAAAGRDFGRHRVAVMLTGMF